MATNTWSETAPLGTVAANTIETEFQKFRLDIRERVAIDHEMTSDDTGVTRLGGHKTAGFSVQASTPTNVTNVGFLYVKDVSGKVELHWEDEDGNELVFTSAGNYLWTDAKDIVLATGTGTKIGTATGQKLGFWNTTPVAQPAHNADPAACAGMTATLSGVDTGTDMTAAQAATIVADLLALKTAVDANNASIDALNADAALVGFTASS